MQIIFRIIVILAVAALISAGFYTAFNNSSSANTSPEGGFRPEGGQERGGHGGGSLPGALAGMIGSLLKVGLITGLLLLLQKGFNTLRGSASRHPASV